MCDVIEDAEAGVYGHWLQPLPPVALQRLHPAEFRWVDLVGFLDNLGSLDLHKRFLKLGQWLSREELNSIKTNYNLPCISLFKEIIQGS